MMQNSRLLVSRFTLDLRAIMCEGIGARASVYILLGRSTRRFRKLPV